MGTETIDLNNQIDSEKLDSSMSYIIAEAETAAAAVRRTMELAQERSRSVIQGAEAAATELRDEADAALRTAAARAAEIVEEAQVQATRIRREAEDRLADAERKATQLAGAYSDLQASFDAFQERLNGERLVQGPEAHSGTSASGNFVTDEATGSGAAEEGWDF
jgi:hypothetical protein